MCRCVNMVQIGLFCNVKGKRQQTSRIQYAYHCTYMPFIYKLFKLFRRAVYNLSVHIIDVKNITLQIKNMFFFSFIKKTLKTLNYSIHSSKKHCQYESNKVNNTATKHLLCPWNGVFAHEKCVIFVILYVFVFNNNKNDIKKQKKT